MSSASLNRMSVFGSGNPANTGLLMPKMKYRFRVSFTNFGPSGGDVVQLTQQVMDFTRPTVNFEEYVVDIYNSKVKLAGKHTWDDVTCNLRDDATGAVANLVGQQLQKQMDFLEMASAAAGINYKFTTIFQVLDGGNGASAPQVLETWELYGCYLKSVAYGDANYATSEPMTVALTIAYDNAAQSEMSETADTASGIGGVLGRVTGSIATGAGSQ